MKKILIFIFLFCLSCLFASGQVEQIIIPGDLKQQTIITEPVTLRKGYLRSGIESAFIVVDKMFDGNGSRSYIQNSNVWGKFRGFALSTQYGLSDKLEISLKIPYITQQYMVSIKYEEVYHDEDSLISFKSKGNGIGDLETGVRFQILEETSARPSLTTGLDITIPTGRKNPANIISDLQYDYPPGDGRIAFGINLDLRKTIYPYSLRLRSYYEYYLKGKKVLEPGEEKTEFKDGDMFKIQGNFSFHLNDWIALWNDLSYTRYAKGTKYYDIEVISPVSWSADYNPALYFQIRRIRFLQGVIIPIFGKNIPSDPVYAFGLQYTF
jgi:hypothetical protein